jgi:hypothetical protein
MAIVNQYDTIPITIDRISPIEYRNDIVIILKLQTMTHWAKIHMPDDTMSNM